MWLIWMKLIWMKLIGRKRMVMLPPVILVFDVNALSAASSAEWREFSRVGNCYLPRVVYEEIKLVFDRSPDPALEGIAKAFHRFYATSGWQVSDANAPHAVFTGKPGHTLTRRGTISLAVGRCAYGIAQEFPNSLVVLVSKDRSLLQRLYEISRFNLCGITGESLLQWSRSGQRPIPVSQTFQQFRATHGLEPARSSAAFEQPTFAAALAPPKPLPAVAIRPANSRSSRFSLAMPRLSETLSETKSLLVALVSLTIAAYLVWLLFNATGWDNLLQPPSNPQSLLLRVG
jgi:hypothetical protein